MQMLEAKWAEGKFVCVGLDPDEDKIPQEDLPPSEPIFYSFCTKIVEATRDLVCAYKPNLAFFLAHGSDGVRSLEDIIDKIHKIAPDVPVILDAKVADIGNTNNGYTKFAFDRLEADAITVHPYLGQEALKPFLDRKDKGVIVLCRTSNPGAGEFQDLRIPNSFEVAVDNRDLEKLNPRLYEFVAHRVMHRWNANGNCCLVAGATYPDELAAIRKIAPDMPLLIPGVGKQGGDVSRVVKAAGGKRMVINSSSGIIFAEDPRQATRDLNKQIDLARL